MIFIILDEYVLFITLDFASFKDFMKMISESFFPFSEDLVSADDITVILFGALCLVCSWEQEKIHEQGGVGKVC